MGEFPKRGVEDPLFGVLLLLLFLYNQEKYKENKKSTRDDVGIVPYVL